MLYSIGLRQSNRTFQPLPTIPEETYVIHKLESKKSFNIKYEEKLTEMKYNEIIEATSPQHLLFTSARNGNIAVTKALIEIMNPSIINIKDKYGNTALHYAVTGNSKVVKILLTYGAAPNSKNISGHTPLHLHVLLTTQDDTSIIYFLVKNGADPTIKSKDGQTAIDIARKNNLTHITHMLQEYQENRKLVDV